MKFISAAVAVFLIGSLLLLNPNEACCADDDVAHAFYKNGKRAVKNGKRAASDTKIGMAMAELNEERRHSSDYYKRASPLAALDSAVAAGELAIKIQDRAIELVDALGGAEQLKDRHRSLELVIANDLPSTELRFAQEYFSSGTWFSQPDAGVAPMDATIATVANRQGSWLTGVTGGMSWEIVGTGKYLVLGFTNPQFGSYKTWIGVRDSPSAVYGYDHSYDDSFKLLCQDGFSLIARMKESDIAMRRIVYGIGDCTE